MHRSENADDERRLSRIVDLLIDVAQVMPVVFPLHPRTRLAIAKTGRLTKLETAVVVGPPVGFVDMVKLEANAAVVATDSGGVQREAFFHRVPCIVLRDRTEWPELVDADWCRLVPPFETLDAGVVLTAVGTTGEEIQPYGSGAAADRIAAAISRSFR